MLVVANGSAGVRKEGNGLMMCVSAQCLVGRDKSSLTNSREEEL